MNALQEEALKYFAAYASKVAKLRDELRAAEVDRDYWRDLLLERCLEPSDKQSAIDPEAGS